MVKAKLLLLIKQHAAVLSLSEAFLIARYLFIRLAVLVWLAGPTQPPLHPSSNNEVPEMLAEEFGGEWP